jgi:hypothetical protein
MERFENLAKRLFRVVKDDLEKVEDTVEEALEPGSKLEPDE